MKSPIHGLHELVVAVNSLMKSVGIVKAHTSGSYLNKFFKFILLLLKINKWQKS